VQSSFAESSTVEVVEIALGIRRSSGLRKPKDQVSSGPFPQYWTSKTSHLTVCRSANAVVNFSNDVCAMDVSAFMVVALSIGSSRVKFVQDFQKYRPTDLTLQTRMAELWEQVAEGQECCMQSGGPRLLLVHSRKVDYIRGM